ncbi:PAS domain S-box protein [Capilliphycus salinus ALCB114379]|uniref:PAS domain S-box protein n=1 Tax=Capilliphycus salinus TaxID=2768948 RepID=UPI0039A75201
MATSLLFFYLQKLILEKKITLGVYQWTVIYFVALLIAVLIAILTSNFISKPLNKLRQAISAIAEGKLDNNQESFQGFKIKEIQRLANSCFQITNQLTTLSERLEQTNQDLEFIINQKTANLQLSEKKFKKAFQNLPLAIKLSSPKDGKIIDVNESFIRLTGYSKSEVISRSSLELNLWNNHQDRARIIQQLKHHKRIENQELQWRTKTGKLIDIELFGEWIDFGGEPRILLVASDITQRQQAQKERELRQVHLQFQQVVMMELFQCPDIHNGNLQAALQTITQIAAHTLNISRVGIWFYNQERSQIRCVNLYELLLRQHSQGQEIYFSEDSTYLKTIESEQLIAVENTQIDFRTQELCDPYLIPNGITSMLDVPICSGGKIVGIICLEQIGTPRTWQLEEQNFAAYLAYITSLALETRDRAKAETALRQSEERFRQLAENIESIFWMIDPHQQQAIYVSPAYEKIWGRCRQKLYRQPLSYLAEGIHPEDRQSALKKMTEKFQSNQELEYRIIRPDGNIRWIRDRSFPIRNETGEIYRVAGIAEDITSRKEAESILQHRVELEQLVTSISTQFINLNADEIDSGIQAALQRLVRFMQVDCCYLFLLSEDGKQIRNTHQWCATQIEPKCHYLQNFEVEYFPYFLEKLRNFEVLNIANIADLPEAASREKTTWMKQSIQSILCVPMVSRSQLFGFVEFDAIRQPKTWTEASISILKLIGEIFVSALERQRVEETLRLTQFGVDRAIDAVFWVDKNARFFYVNEAACQSLEYSQEKLLKMTVHDIDPDFPLEVWSEHWQQLQAQGSMTFETRHRTASGRIFPVEITANHLIFGTQEFNFCFVRDISERKQAEEQMQASLKEKEVLLREIHHRVKNNLYIISNLLDLQSDVIEDENLLALFSDSQTRIQSMALIHEQLYQATDLGQVNFGDYIHRLVENLFFSLGDTQGLVKSVVDVEPIQINLETAIPCGLLINELITNALKHAFPDGRPGEVYVEFYQDLEQKLHLTVRDNGVGISPDIDWENSPTLGLKLVQILSKQLRANFNINSSGGTCIELIFSQLKYKSRF